MDILLDVGGTRIKGGVFDRAGNLLGGIMEFDAKAKESKETVIENFCSILTRLRQTRPDEEAEHIGFAFPGPFDYERGVSYIRGLDKYESIYGLSLEEEIKKKEGCLRGARMFFMHDIEAFARGVCARGEAAGQKRVLCLCIGTGTGSAFMENGAPIRTGGKGVPENGQIYAEPFGDSVVDDYLSSRGLKAICRRLTGTERDGKELFELCKKNDAGALAVYREFGELVNACMEPYLRSFRPAVLVIGGQISKSLIYFGEKLEKTCRELGIQILVEENTSLRAMQGLHLAAI